MYDVDVECGVWPECFYSHHSSSLHHTECKLWIFSRHNLIDVAMMHSTIHEILYIYLLGAVSYSFFTTVYHYHLDLALCGRLEVCVWAEVYPRKQYQLCVIQLWGQKTSIHTRLHPLSLCLSLWRLKTKLQLDCRHGSTGLKTLLTRLLTNFKLG